MPGQKAQRKEGRQPRAETPTPGFPPLAAAASPSLYRRNAFRITQLPLDATSREVAQRFEEVRIKEQLGAAVTVARGPLALLPPPELTTLRAALQRLRDPEQRLVDEVFWFWPLAAGNGAGDRALQALAAGDVESAERSWLNGSDGRRGGAAQLHNLAVLAHASALDLEQATPAATAAGAAARRDQRWRQAYDRWRLLLAGEGFWQLLGERIERLADPRLTDGTSGQIRASLPMVLLDIQAQLALRAASAGDRPGAARHAGLARASGFESRLVESAFQLAVKPTCERLRLLCTAAEQEVTGRAAQGATASQRLLRESAPLLAVLDDLLAKDDPVRAGSHDEVAQQVLSCQISYGNATDDWVVCQELLAAALQIAVGETARARLQTNAEIVGRNLAAALCHFCQQAAGVDGADREVALFGDVRRTPTPGGTRVEWRKLTIKVSRCRACQAIHLRQGRAASIGGFVGFLAGLGVAGAMIAAEANGCFVLLALAFFTGIGSAIGSGFVKRPAHVKAAEDVKGYPPVAQRLKQGWKIGAGPS